MENRYMQGRIHEILQDKIAMGAGYMNHEDMDEDLGGLVCQKYCSKRRVGRPRGGAKGSTNPWIRHVQLFWAENPDLTYQEAMREARASYMPKGMGISVGGAKRKSRSGSKSAASRSRSKSVKRSGSKTAKKKYSSKRTVSRSRSKSVKRKSGSKISKKRITPRKKIMKRKGGKITKEQAKAVLREMYRGSGVAPPKGALAALLSGLNAKISVD